MTTAPSGPSLAVMWGQYRTHVHHSRNSGLQAMNGVFSGAVTIGRGRTVSGMCGVLRRPF
jgi:hypothetical protein